MLRRHHRFFQSLQLLRDAVLVTVAFWLAYAVRFYTDLFPFGTPSTPRETTAVAIMVVSVWPIVGWAGKLYVSHRTRSFAAETFDVLKTTLFAFLILVTITYFLRDVRYSRITLLLWAMFAFSLVSVFRIASRTWLRVLRARGYNLRHVVVVGVGDLARRVISTVEAEAALGLRVVGILAPEEDADQVGRHIAGVPIIGMVGQTREILHRRFEEGAAVDQVIVALPVEKMSALKGIMKVLSLETVDVRLVPDVYQYATLCGSVEEFSGMPIINLQATPLRGWGLVGKRLFDIVVALVASILLGPVMVAVAFIIRYTGEGPVLFRQPRVGMDGREFWMYKFRTMEVNAESCGAQMTRFEDPRCTSVGRILRRFSLDELPQLWNVLKGDMSLVGPRPEQPAFIEDFKKEIPRYALRHKIKAGMTGWAQINGLRGNTSIKKRIELDLYYIENWSLLMDAKILFRTLAGGFLSPNAY